MLSIRLEALLKCALLYISISVLFHFLCQVPDDAMLHHHLILRPLTAAANSL